MVSGGADIYRYITVLKIFGDLHPPLLPLTLTRLGVIKYCEPRTSVSREKYEKRGLFFTVLRYFHIRRGRTRREYPYLDQRRGI